MDSMSFDPAQSPLGLTMADIEDLAAESMRQYADLSRPSQQKRAFRELSLLMSRDAAAAPLAAAAVTSTDPDEHMLLEFAKALGVAASDCKAKGACAVAQRELMRLKEDPQCAGACDSQVLHELGRAATLAARADHHPRLAASLGKHGRRLMGSGGDSPSPSPSGQGGTSFPTCEQTKNGRWSYPKACTATDANSGCSWGIEIDAALGWGCRNVQSQDGGSTVKAQAALYAHVFGKKVELYGGNGEYQAAGGVTGSTGAWGDLTATSNSIACSSGTCGSWKVRGASEAVPASTAANPPSAPSSQPGAFNCSKDLSWPDLGGFSGRRAAQDDKVCHPEEVVSDYIYLDPPRCGDQLHNPRPFISTHMSLPFSMSVLFGVVEVSGEIGLTGTGSLEYGAEVDVCSNFAGDTSSQHTVGAYVSGGAVVSASVGMEVTLSGSVPFVIKLAVSTEMTIIRGSLTALASVGGSTNLDTVATQGLLNVDYSTDALDGKVSFQVQLLFFFHYEWDLFKWNGRELSNAPLMEYNIATGKEQKAAVNFAQGDVADFQACDPNSRSANKLCQSSYCAWRPDNYQCDWNGEGTPSCDSASSYICRPVDGFDYGTPCGITAAPKPLFGGDAPLAVNPCAEGLFCYAGSPYAIQVREDSPEAGSKECWEYKSGLMESDGDGQYNGCAWTRLSRHCPDQPKPRPFFSYSAKDSLAYRCCCEGHYKGYEGVAAQGYGQTCQKPLDVGVPIPHTACLSAPAAGSSEGKTCLIGDKCSSDYCLSQRCKVLPSERDQHGTPVFGGSLYAVCSGS